MRVLSVVSIAACAASLAWFQPHGGHGVAALSAATQSPSPSTIFIDASVVDDEGRAVMTLRAQDLRVTVDGTPRPIVSLRFVYRGPGAEAAASVADPTREAPAAAERSRSLLLLVDESTIPRGQEKLVVGVAGRLLDELGSADQAAVAAVPAPPGQIVLTTNPASRHASLSRVVGRAVPETSADQSQLGLRASGENPDRGAGARGGDPDEQARLTEAEREAADRARRVQGDGGGAAEFAQQATGARVTTRALLSIVEGVRSLPGLKTLIVLRQAEPPGGASTAPPPQERQSDVANLLAAAARARAVIHLVVVGPAAKRRSPAEEDLRAIAAASGGTVTVAKSAGDSKAFDAVRGALWGGYLVEVEGRESDKVGRPHAVKVETARSRATLMAPQLWVPRYDPVPQVIAAAPKAEPPLAIGPQSSGRPARLSRPDDPQLVVLLARLTEYLAVYVRDFGSVVAEEDYHQRMIRGERGQTPIRHLRSDLLLVKTAAGVGWAQYRDVFEVDGKPVRDREERVQKLFLENPNGAWQLAQDISNESARYNIGTLTRTINLPTLPLAFLGTKYIGGLSFWRDGDDSVGGIRAVRLSFEEMSRPTLVRPLNWPGDAPASGTLWIDPASGRILKTRISVTAGRSEMQTTVVYKAVPDIGLWLPAEMEERYFKPDEEIEGRAVYKNFRSFKVTTDMQIK
jgi:hypothetical protein